jgi:integrase-like protein
MAEPLPEGRRAGSGCTAGKDASGLDGYTWHCNRHTFASRLVMASVDLRTVQDLGGWRTLGMVQRYAYLAPDHLQAAVERLVSGGTVQNFGVTSTYPASGAPGVS